MNSLKSIPWKFYGVIVLPLCSIMGVAMHGTQTYGWPVLFPVITKEFGWSAAVAATASSLARFEGGLEGILAGWVMDKYGPRITYLLGGIAMGVGWIALSFVTADNIVWYFIFFGVIVQTGGNVGGYSSGYKVVNNWWIKWRARATAAFVLPVALAGTFSPIIIAGSIATNGWRTTLVYMGIFCFCLFIPAGIFIRPHKPEYYGLLPDGDDPKKVVVDATAAEKKSVEQALLAEAAKKQRDYTIKDAMKTQTFWIYTLSQIFYNFGFNGVTLFVPAHLTSRGYDLGTAAMFAGLMLTFSYVGRFAVFFFGDHISPKIMSWLCWTLSGVGVLCLANATADAVYLAWGYSVIYGIAYGMSFTMVPVVKAWLFGRTAFGVINGVTTTVSMIGSITVPIVMGMTFDANGNYWLGYTLVGVSFWIACLIFIFVKRPSQQAATSSAAPRTA